MKRTENIKLHAEKRTQTGKHVSALRESGYVPGVVYGKGVENENVSIPQTEFEKAFDQAGENTLIDLLVDGKEPRTVLIHEVATDVLKDAPIHVDFYQVRLDEKITTTIPLSFVGVSVAVKELEGTLVKTMHDIEVESLPRDIPHELEVDISKLKTFDDHIIVSDISAPENVEILAESDEVVALVKPPRSEEELEALDEEVVEDVDAVEVEGEKDEEDEEAVEEGAEEGAPAAESSEEDKTTEE